jgi:hypothetical protein
MGMARQAPVPRRGTSATPRTGLSHRLPSPPVGMVYNTIATGFPVNLASQYGILAPAGLSYNPTSDTLYIVSSANNSVVAFKAVSTIPANGITVTENTMTMALSFTGPNASQASVVYSGAPLNYPVSSAILYNGNLVVGNTGDNNMVEIDPVQQKWSARNGRPWQCRSHLRHCYDRIFRGYAEDLFQRRQHP